MNTFTAPAMTQIFKKYLDDVSAWHGYVRFLGLPSLQKNLDIPIEELYIPHALSESQIKSDEDPSKWTTFDPVEALAKYKRLVILGDPGSGKSTLINWFAWYLASGFSRRLAGNLGECLPVPFVLRDLDLTNVVNFNDLIDSLLQRPVAKELNTHREELDKYLRSGQTLLLFDGLDEISYEMRVKIRSVIHDGMQKFPKCYYLFTSRIVGYEEVPIGIKRYPSRSFYFPQPQTNLGFGKRWGNLITSERPFSDTSGLFISNYIKVCYVAPFNNEQVSLFALNWYREQGGPDTEARLLSQSFVSAIRSTATTNQLARTPNLLTMMALIFRVRAQLPDGTALLYEDIAQAYLESIDNARQLKDEFSWIRKKRWLARVGFEMQMLRVKQLSSESPRSQELLVSRDEVLGWISDAMLLSGDSASIGYAEKYLNWITKRSGLLIPRGASQFAFLHLSFQEYFCAVYIKQQLENPDWRSPENDLDKVLDSRVDRDALKEWATDTVWHQTLIFIFELFAGMPGWPKTLMGIFFAKPWNSTEDFGWVESKDQRILGVGIASNTKLHCWLQVICNPHSGLQQGQRDNLFLEAFNLSLEQQRFLGKQTSSFLQRHINPNILVHLLMSNQYFDKTITALERESNVFYLSLLDIDANRFKRVISIFEDLKKLVVNELRDEDLRLISKLTKLESLMLWDCELFSFEIFRNLNLLSYLSLDESRITSLDGFGDLPQLKVLSMDDTNISSLEPLSNQKLMVNLSVDRSRIRSLSGVDKIAKLETLSISGTLVNDFTPLRFCKNLQFFVAADTAFSDLNLFSEMTALQVLFLDRTHISNLNGLCVEGDLEFLSVSDTSISDLTPLSKLKSLEILRLDGTKVVSLDPIVNLKKLKVVDLDNTKVSTVSSLAKLQSLEYISIRNTNVRSVRSLERLPNLKELNMEGTPAKANTVGSKIKKNS